MNEPLIYIGSVVLVSIVMTAVINGLLQILPGFPWGMSGNDLLAMRVIMFFVVAIMTTVVV